MSWLSKGLKGSWDFNKGVFGGGYLREGIKGLGGKSTGGLGKAQLAQILKLLQTQKADTANAFGAARQQYALGNQGVQQGYLQAMLAAQQGASDTRTQMAGLPGAGGMGAGEAANHGMGAPVNLGIIGDTSRRLASINAALASSMGQLGVQKGLAQAQGFGKIGNTYAQGANQQVGLTSDIANSIAGVQHTQKPGLAGTLSGVLPYLALAAV